MRYSYSLNSVLSFWKKNSYLYLRYYLSLDLD